MTEDEMVGWHHHLNGHEFEQTLGDSEGQGSLVCCSPWGCKKSDTTEQLNNNNVLSLSCQLDTQVGSSGCRCRSLGFGGEVWAGYGLWGVL